jgi:TolB protein
MTRTVDRIALITYDGELVTVNRHGEQRHALTSGDRFFQFPAWSPVGTRVAVVGANRRASGVFIFDDADSGAIEPAAENTVYESTRNAPIYLYWSPDAGHVSFIAIQPDESSMGLHIASSNKAAMKEGNRTNLVATGRPCFWEWSPDGKRVMVHTGSMGNTEDQSRLALVDPFSPSGMSKSELGNPGRPGYFQAPAISRSGRYRAFGQVNRKNQVELIVESPEDGEQMTVRHEGVAALSWSPTDDQLAFICPPEPLRTYYGPLRVLNTDNGEMRVLTDEIVLAFFWSPTGDRIAYFTVANTTPVLSHVRPDPVQAVQDGGALPAPTTENEDVDDEQMLWLNVWVVDLNTDDTHLVATFEPVDIFVNQFLPFFDQYAKSHRIWSPSGDALVLPMVRRDENDGLSAHVCVVPINPGFAPEPPVAIAEGLMAFWSPG